MKAYQSARCSPLFTMTLVFITFLATPPAMSIQNSQDTIPQYGLFETTFTVAAGYENSFDSSHISVDAEIRPDSGEAITTPCFYDGDNAWKLRFTPAQSGTYSYRITARTPAGATEVHSGQFHVTPRSGHGFIRICDSSRRHFAFENGESYFPLGENLGWVSPPTLNTWTGYLNECADAKINWIRIWMCPWGMTELEWAGSRYHGLGQYSLENARMIDGIFREAEQRGIYIQWVINHHGQYSTETNPIWSYNPYNINNGGFLRRPGEFFTHAEAKRRYRDRLRYLAARWGYSTHLMAWEFWNEVNLTSNFDFSAVKQWHEEMAEYLRSIDPYHHLVTTSSAGDFDLVSQIQGLDYLQTHAYVTGVIDKVMNTSRKSAQQHPDRPHFFGEMSYDYRGPNTGDRDGVILHNQLWASVHSWDSGTAMTWWWDNWVRPYNLYSHFEILSKYIAVVDWTNKAMMPLETQVAPRQENWGDFIFAPGRGWGATSGEEFVIRSDGVVENLNECTSFVHGQYHRAMAPNPIFLLTASTPTHFGIRIQRISRAGATCLITLDGDQVIRRVFQPAQNDYTPGDEGDISFAVPAGDHRIAVRNTGLDWFEIKHYWIENYAQRPVAYARGNDERVLVWIHDRPHQYAFLNEYSKYGPISPTVLTIPAIQHGQFIVEQFDPYSGNVVFRPNLHATDKGLTIEVPAFQRDMAFRIQKLSAAVENAFSRSPDD